MTSTHKSLTIIGESFACDRDCPYCTAKITRWPGGENRYALLPARLEEARLCGLSFDYATLSGNGEPSLGSLAELRFVRRCLDSYAGLFGGFRLQTSGHAFFRPEIMALFAGWDLEITRVSHDAGEDMATLRYRRDYLQTDAFRGASIVLNIVLLKGMDVAAEVGKYAQWANVKAINLVILNANTLGSGFDNPYSQWILANGLREADVATVADAMSASYELVAAYDDYLDSYEWRDTRGRPVRLYARKAPYGRRNLVFHQGRYIDYNLDAVDIGPPPGAPLAIVVDGNDGTGKSTLIKGLAELGYHASDRGLPTRMTDDDSLVGLEHERYLILDATVATCRQRLAMAGRDLEERYHTVADLEHYRQKFLAVAARLGNAIIIDAEREPDEVLRECTLYLAGQGILPASKETSC